MKKKKMKKKINGVGEVIHSMSCDLCVSWEFGTTPFCWLMMVEGHTSTKKKKKNVLNRVQTQKRNSF